VEKEEQTFTKNEPEAAAPSTGAVFTVDTGKMQCSRHGFSSSEPAEVVPLQAGDEGLLVAEFSHGVHTTELSNLVLAHVPKCVKEKKAAAPIQRKPAAAAPVQSEVPAAPVPVAAAAAGGNNYAIMYYKNTRTIGIREKFGGKHQIGSFGGIRCAKTEEQLRGIGEDVVADLNGGVSVKDAITKAKELAKAE
jgi:hypothetical protein